ncbi:MAG: 3-deoxy-manno-octulosonate-8-phosphatase KdsC [Phycisphaerales bacterium]
MSHPGVPDAALVEMLKGVGVRAVVADVDGTLTDGSLYTTSDGQVIRRFTTIDGMGHNILHNAGVSIAWLSATSEGASVARRAEMLRVRHVDTGSGDKGPRFEALCAQMGVDAAHTLYIGDDINDLPAMERAARCFCPADAHPTVIDRVDVVLDRPGGHGAFRQLADAVLLALGKDAVAHV